MKLSSVLSSALLVAGLMVSASTSTFAQGMAPVQGHGGNSLGKLTPLNDLELTAISKLEEAMIAKEMDDAAKANAALARATAAKPKDDAAIAAATQAVADTTAALSAGRAAVFARIQTEYFKGASPEKLAAVQSAINNPVTQRRGGGRGGRGAQAPGAAAAQPAVTPAPAAGGGPGNG